jgi:hypothetical protein
VTDLSVRVVLAGDFVRANADGKASLESMRELARRLVHADRDAGRKPILLDLRELTGTLSDLDVVKLIDEMLQSRADFRTRVALLVRDNQAHRARFMETYARNRTVPIGAFTDVAEAARWLGDAAST